MDFLIVIALIVFLVSGIIFMYKYCDFPNQYNPNTVKGRMENRYKRELEQRLYENVFLPLLNVGGFIIVGAIVIVIVGVLYLLGVR